MTIFYIILLAAFALAAGAGIGCGNYRGLGGALLPGIATGALLCLPTLRQGEWLIPIVFLVGALAGSIIATYIPEENGFKHLCRNQRLLKVHIGSGFRLGADEPG